MAASQTSEHLLPTYNQATTQSDHQPPSYEQAVRKPGCQLPTYEQLTREPDNLGPSHEQTVRPPATTPLVTLTQVTQHQVTWPRAIRTPDRYRPHHHHHRRRHHRHLETTPQVINSDETTENGFLCYLIVWILISCVGSLINILFTNLSSSTYPKSTTTVYKPSESDSNYLPHKPNRSSPSFNNSGENKLERPVAQEFQNYLPNVPSLEKNSCNLPGCKKIVADVLNSINRSVDPCHNFYDFACQGWQKSNPRPEYMPEWSVFSKLSSMHTRRVIKILEKPIALSRHETLNDAKYFYRKCIDLHNKSMNENEDNAAIQIMLHNLVNYGGWPILYENGTWNKSKFDWIQLVVGLKRQFQSAALLDVSSEQFPSWMNKKNTIHVKPPPSPSSLETIDKFVELNKRSEGVNTKSVLKLQNFIVNISRTFLQLQGKTNVNESFLEEKALDLVSIHVILQSATESSPQLTSNEQIYLGISADSIEVNTSLGTIQTVLEKYLFPSVNKLNVLKLVQTLYKNSKISIDGHKQVIITDLPYLLNLAKFISETKEEALANYLHFRMTLLMIPLTGNTKLNRILDDFQNEIKGTLGKKRKSELCAEYTQEKFPFAVGQAYVNSKYYNKLEFEQAKITFENVKTAFTKLIESSSTPNFNKAVWTRVANSTTLCLGYPSWMKILKRHVELIYSGLVMNESATFLEQSIAVNMWTVDKAYSLLAKRLPNYENGAECQWSRFPGFIGTHKAIMQYTVYLPLGIIEPPFYDIFMPLPLIYGKLGSILGDEILHGFVVPSHSELKSGRLRPFAKCLVHQYSNFSTEALRKENVTLNGLKTLGENIPDNAGLLGAYKAFKESRLLDNLEVIELKRGGEKTEDFTDDQLFFLGFAQNWCENTSRPALRTSLQNDVHPPGMFRVLGALQNSQEFAAAWNCPSGSNMNPFPKDHQKCKIF